MNFTIENLAIGDVIQYAAFGGEVRTVRITNLDSDIKNGREGFDGEMVDGAFPGYCWGYCYQILRVLNKDATPLF